MWWSFILIYILSSNFLSYLFILVQLNRAGFIEEMNVTEHIEMMCYFSCTPNHMKGLLFICCKAITIELIVLVVDYLLLR